MRGMAVVAFLAGVSVTVSSCMMDAPYAPADYSCIDSAAHDTDTHPERDRFEALVERGARDGLPGIVMYVRTPDGHTWTGAAGMADLAYSEPMRPCNHMLIASVSKVFTATMVFRLYEEGLLNIDDKLDEYLDRSITDNLQNGHDVTLRQMLNHTSGLYDYLEPMSYDLDSIQNPSRTLSQEQKLVYAYGRRANNRPGEAFYYSNTNYTLLGMVVEEVTGRFLGDVFETELFAPLGLSSGYYGSHHNPIPPNTPRGYFLLFGEDRLVDSHHIYVNDLNTGDGGVAINMHDMGTYIEEVFRGNVIAASTLAEMTGDTVEIPDDQRGLYWTYDCLGMEIYDTPYGRAFGHTGAIYGFLTILFHFPESGATLAFSMNGTSPDIMSVREQLLDNALALMFEPE
ncbi:MAG: beta-lactamase family protein [Spirochaetales bacterium]|nr:beta-lactamase family protein [Spirochaetales bacterium]